MIVSYRSHEGLQILPTLPNTATETGTTVSKKERKRTGTRIRQRVSLEKQIARNRLWSSLSER